jgi:hypothetical protein
MADSGPRLEAALKTIVREVESAVKRIAKRGSGANVADDGSVAGAIEEFVREIRDAIRDEVHGATREREHDNQRR